MRNVHYFGMEDDFGGLPDGAVNFSVDDIIGRDQKALDENNAALERLSVIQTGLEAGLPFDMKALSAELGIGSGLNRAMESFYMGDAPKKTMTIALEEVGVVQVGLIAAGIGVLAVIMKKIYEWLKNFFGGSSGSGGGGGGSSSGSETINAVAEAAKPLKELKQEIPKLPAVVKETLAAMVASDSPEAEKAKEGQGGLVTVHDYMAKPEEHVGNNVAIPKHQPSKADEAGVHIPTNEGSHPSDEMEDFYAEFSKGIKSKRIIFVSKSSRGMQGMTDEECVKAFEDIAHVVDTVIYPKIEEFSTLLKNNGLGSPLKLYLGTIGHTDASAEAKKALAFIGTAGEFAVGFSTTIGELVDRIGAVKPGERPKDPTVYINNVLRLADSFFSIMKVKNAIAASAIYNVGESYSNMIKGIEEKMKSLGNNVSEEERQNLATIKEALEDIVKAYRIIGSLLAGMWKQGHKVARCIVGLTYELRDVINQTTSRTTLTSAEVECLKDIGNTLRYIQTCLSNKDSMRLVQGRHLDSNKK